jgi:hypothetical protein
MHAIYTRVCIHADTRVPKCAWLLQLQILSQRGVSARGELIENVEVALSLGWPAHADLLQEVVLGGTRHNHCLILEENFHVFAKAA